MKKAEYLNLLKETLELEKEADETTILDDLFNWDSMAHILVIARTQTILGKQLIAADLGRCRQLGDIIALVGDSLEG